MVVYRISGCLCVLTSATAVINTLTTRLTNELAASVQTGDDFFTKTVYPDDPTVTVFEFSIRHTLQATRDLIKTDLTKSTIVNKLETTNHYSWIEIHTCYHDSGGPCDPATQIFTSWGVQQ